MVQDLQTGDELNRPKGAHLRDDTPPPRPTIPTPGQSESDIVEEHGPEKPMAELGNAVEEKEFGGPVGAVLIMLGSHVFLYGVAATLYGTNPMVYLPTLKSTVWFLAYHFAQYLLARTMPGVWVNGQTGKGYWCNAYCSFWFTIVSALSFHALGIFDLTNLVAEYPAFLTTAVVLGNTYSVINHLYYARGSQKLSVYDFFMGVEIHPRIGIVDVKMVAEVRLSWTLLLLITLGAFIQTARDCGTWLNPALFMVLAHGLYGNATAKGEHFIPYTWDITTEKFGWMLCWWNLVGVPLFYCYQSLFLARYSVGQLVLPEQTAVYYGALVVALLMSYYVWDEAQYNRCYFRMEQRGELINRSLFPTFRKINNPKYIKCEVGTLLIDGWFAYARKIHYTMDVCMALLWGLSCGFGSLMPYAYVLFFATMITHRNGRDQARCRQKYGATWDKYLKIVPYAFIPGVY